MSQEKKQADNEKERISQDKEELTSLIKKALYFSMVFGVFIGVILYIVLMSIVENRINIPLFLSMSALTIVFYLLSEKYLKRLNRKLKEIV